MSRVRANAISSGSDMSIEDTNSGHKTPSAQASAARPVSATSIAQLAAQPPRPLPTTDRKASGGELVIGRGIQVKGQIGACKTLVVEGELDASVEVETLLLLEGGVFKGNAVVENADLAGELDGKLTVRGRLHLGPTARAAGEIRYKRIVIDDGGRLSGDISVLEEDKGERAEPVKQRLRAGLNLR